MTDNGATSPPQLATSPDGSSFGSSLHRTSKSGGGSKDGAIHPNHNHLSGSSFSRGSSTSSSASSSPSSSTTSFTSSASSTTTSSSIASSASGNPSLKDENNKAKSQKYPVMTTGPTPAHLRAVGHPAGKVFIGGLSWETTDEGMRSYFSKFGTVVDSVVIRDRATDRSRGFGFVVFTTPEAAIAACSPSVHQINGRPVEAKRAIPKDEITPTPKTSKLFIAGISPAHRDEDLRNYFERFGDLTECQIVRDRSGRARGYGFVSYIDESSVDMVLKASTHMVAGYPVDVKKSKPAGQAPSRYQMNFQQPFQLGHPADGPGGYPEPYPQPASFPDGFPAPPRHFRPFDHLSPFSDFPPSYSHLPMPPPPPPPHSHHPHPHSHHPAPHSHPSEYNLQYDGQLPPPPSHHHPPPPHSHPPPPHSHHPHHPQPHSSSSPPHHHHHPSSPTSSHPHLVPPPSHHPHHHSSPSHPHHSSPLDHHAHHSHQPPPLPPHHHHHPSSGNYGADSGATMGPPPTSINGSDLHPYDYPGYPPYADHHSIPDDHNPADMYHQFPPPPPPPSSSPSFQAHPRSRDRFPPPPGPLPPSRDPRGGYPY